MLPKLPADNRIRDMLMYHGAGTGRWTGKMVQPHNFPRGSLKPKEAGLACELIREDNKEFIEMLWGSDDPNAKKALTVMEVLSSALRGSITAAPGNDLVVADYSSIEARVLVWLVGDKKALDVFHSGKDIYKDMAVSIYNVPYEEVDDEQRRMGKQAILGLGYQMGPDKFKFTLWDSYDIHIELDLAQMVVDAYRIRYAKVKAFWNHINECAIRAVKNPNRVVKVNDKVMFKFSKGFLRCRLPSGRTLYYRDPRIKKKELPWGGKADTLTYMNVDGKTKKWVRTDTYGGKLTENVVQAIARDFMGYGISNINDHGKYQIILSVHDELLAECPGGTGDYEEFEDLMATLPPWGAGCPVAAEGWQGIRYRKD
jgi:DNA polymerase